MSAHTRAAAMEAWARRNPRAFDPPGTPEQLAELRRRSDEEDRLNDEFIRQECIREGKPIPPGLLSSNGKTAK